MTAKQNDGAVMHHGMPYLCFRGGHVFVLWFMPPEEFSGLIHYLIAHRDVDSEGMSLSIGYTRRADGSVQAHSWKSQLSYFLLGLVRNTRPLYRPGFSPVHLRPATKVSLPRQACITVSMSSFALNSKGSEWGWSDEPLLYI